MSNTKRAVIYARLSQSEKRDTKDPKKAGQVSSLDGQIKACFKLAEQQGYDVVDSAFVDDGVSAWSGVERPGYVELIDRVRKGDVGVILAVEDSRLTRDVGDNLYLQTVCIQNETFWHTAAGGLTDPSTPHGKMMANFKANIDAYESDLKAIRVRNSVQRRLDAVVDIGGPRPFGWEADRVTVREVEAVVLRRAYESILNGETVYWVTKNVFSPSGISPPRARNSLWRTQTVRNMLLAPRHYGRLVVKGIDYGRATDGIVSEETWTRVRALLTNPSRNQKRGVKDKYFTGVARCGTCGSRMGASSASDTRCRREGDQAAQGAHASIKQHILEDVILKAVEDAFIFGYPAEFQRHDSVTEETHSILTELTRLREAQARTLRDRNNGDIPDEVASAELNRLRDLSESLKQRQSELESKSALAQVFAAATSKVFKTSETSLSDARRAGTEYRQAFLDLSVHRQRGLLEALFSVTVNAGERGGKRVKVVHKIARSLGEDEGVPTPFDLGEL